MTYRAYAGLLALALGLAGAIAPARASIYIDVEDETATPGSTVLIGVFASADLLDVLNLSGFDLPFDIDTLSNSSAGNALPAGITLHPTLPIQNGSPLLGPITITTLQNAFVNIDGIFKASGGSLPITGVTAVKLFDIAINVGLAVPEGSVYDIKLLSSTSPVNFYNVATTPNIAEVINGGKLTIVGVPESGSLISAAGGCLLLAAVAVTRHRSRRLAVALAS